LLGDVGKFLLEFGFNDCCAGASVFDKAMEDVMEFDFLFDSTVNDGITYFPGVF
jgi:hypothetical protein